MANEFKVRKGLIVSGNTEMNGDLFAVGGITAASFTGPLTGNADTASSLQTPRTINGAAFDGSANITTSS